MPDGLPVCRQALYGPYRQNRIAASHLKWISGNPRTRQREYPEWQPGYPNIRQPEYPRTRILKYAI